MNRTVLFEHIPKTGGITLRSILMKVYGEKQMFVINSNHPGSSIDQFKKMGGREREKIKVIAGHGALLYEPFLKNPFKVTILRDPVNLFLSQFYYLKISKKDSFWEDVKEMDSPLEYLDYALSMGQDNLMTRFLATSMQWTVDSDRSFHNMEKSGDELLEQAKSNLRNFDAVINLDHFDVGIFELSRSLNWQSIPLYKPRNRTPSKPEINKPHQQIASQLQHRLRFDIDLYRFFLEYEFDISKRANKKSGTYSIFQTRQKLVKVIAAMLGKY